MGSTIRIRVRLFAMQREAAGTRELSLAVPSPATIDDAWSVAVAQVPALAAGRASLRFAVNGTYADPTTALSDGDEVACIPPVSGGSDDGDAAADQDRRAADQDRPADERRRLLEVRAEPLPDDLATELTSRLATDHDGAAVVFIGRTRITPGSPAPGQEAEAARHADRAVEELEYEAFEPMALAVLGEIADEIEARFAVHRLAIVHRTGAVPLGETSVIVVAASPHRGAAFEAARYAIDETKARAPIWKAEHFSDGHIWIGDPARTAPIDVD